MNQELRNQKRAQVQVVFKGAVRCCKSGEWDMFCDSIAKLLGMAAAFHDLDDELHAYTMDCVNALSRFSFEKVTDDFNAWAVGQACEALKAAVQAPTDKALFQQAITAWEQGDLQAHDKARQTLCQRAINGPLGNDAVFYHTLIVDYLDESPMGQIPFAAFAAGRACQALRACA